MDGRGCAIKSGCKLARTGKAWYTIHNYEILWVNVMAPFFGGIPSYAHAHEKVGEARTGCLPLF